MEYADHNSQAKPDADQVSCSDTVDSAGTQTGFIHEQSGTAGSLRTSGETLLRTLRSVITPLVRPNDGEYKRDANENALGPDGEEFVIALQIFISSFLRSQRGPIGGIEVEVEAITETPNAEDPASNTPHDNLIPGDVDVSLNTLPITDSSLPERNISSHENSPSTEAHNEESPDVNVGSLNDSMSNEAEDTFAQRRWLFFEEISRALKEHVFNVMPLRLLYLRPHASKLQITLIERGEIYSRIATDLETSINFTDVSREIAHLERNAFCSKQEAEMSVIRELIYKYSKYAILSHTWLRGTSGEVTYGDWSQGEFSNQQPGYRKLINFCKAAWEDHGVGFGWMDTICINKESSAELDESIRSMFKWYRGAHVCITYLAETTMLSDMHSDSWFSRGWTLQELIAPSHMKFYNADWIKLVKSSESDKTNATIVKQIENATTITTFELEQPITWLSISRRMQLAAKRKVTREEDTAYCLMGIFDVSMSIAYGEGSDRAHCRLLQEILNSGNGVLDMFNWAGGYGTRISSLLPQTPQGYLRRSSNKQLYVAMRPIEPLMLTHLGLRISVLLMPSISTEDPTPQYDPIGDYHAIADISPLADAGYFPMSAGGKTGGKYSVLDNRISSNDGWNEDRSWYQLTFGILNVGGGDELKLTVPKHCLAVGLHLSTTFTNKVHTDEPVVFILSKKHSPDGNRMKSHPYDSYDINRSELESHGMKLVTLYL